MYKSFASTGVFIVAVLTAVSCSTPECNANNCRGCCRDGVCYLGGCETGAGGGSTSCRASSSACSASTQCCNNLRCLSGVCSSCSGLDDACGPGDCCPQDVFGNPMTCKSGKCARDCLRTSDPCNGSYPCCVDPLLQSELVGYCNLASNKCDLCTRKGAECYSSCCPGLRCLPKPGFPNFKECQE
jgi:hypothetical protein